MSLFQRPSDVRKFTNAKSFMLYMEGLRALQLHEEEAGKASGAAKSDETLRRTLDEARETLSECVVTYPDDLLPRYYYAIVLTLHGQAEQARQLRHDLERPTFQLSGCQAAEIAYEESVKQFGRTAARAPSELKIYAQYNQAQALANQAQAAAAAGRLGESPKFLESALAILQQLRPAEYGLGLSTVMWTRLKTDIGTHADRLKGWLARTAAWLRRTTDKVPGQRAARPGTSPQEDDTAVEPSSLAEGRALQYQVELLRTFIGLWRQVVARTLTLAMLPSGVSLDSADKTGVPELRSLVRGVQFGDLSARARQDLEAEYWNKWARLARAWAQNVDDISTQTSLLKLADAYYTLLKKLGREGWTPAELNHAFVLALQGKHDLARAKLTEILGIGVKAEPPTPAKTTSAEEIRKFIVALPLGTSATTVTHLVKEAFGPLDPATLQALARSLPPANVDAQFLADVVRGLGE